MAALKMFTQHANDAAGQLKEILEGYELPMFPSIYLEALRLVRDDNSSTTALADVVASDPGLTMKLLRAVNSAAFGLRREVSSVHHAVTMLGRRRLESMLVSLASHATLPYTPCHGFQPVRFWKAAARRAATARALARRVNPAEESECFTAALLSDMAVPMLCTRKGEQYGRIVDQWHQGEGELQTMEHETFGWDHAEVAALMCQEWEFPNVIADAIGAHHEKDAESPLALLPVNLAGLMPEVDAERGIESIAEQARTAAGLDPNDVRSLIEDSFQEAEGIAEQFA